MLLKAITSLTFLSVALAVDTENHTTYPELDFTLGTLPQDETPGGATVVGEFAGRVWYGGFSGDVINGDAKSPKLSSYVAFSQLVNNPTMITLCYQAGDPTSDVEPDIIDTDGGFIRLNNAYGIKSFTNLGTSFFVGAANGASSAVTIVASLLPTTLLVR